MTVVAHRGGWVILVSILLGYVLTVLPLPQVVEYGRPEWTALIIVYWCMALPQRVGVGVAWLAGLFQDALQGALLGEHALAFAVVAYITLKLHQRIRVFPLWQQAFSVLVLLLLIRLLLFWIDGLVGRPQAGWTFWVPALTGTMLWPVVFVALREARRRYGVQ